MKKWNFSGTCLYTQSDPGTENNGAANGNTRIRNRLDPSTHGRLCHQWKFRHGNIRAEQAWAHAARGALAGFWDLLFEGTAWFEPTKQLDR